MLHILSFRQKPRPFRSRTSLASLTFQFINLYAFTFFVGALCPPGKILANPKAHDYGFFFATFDPDNGNRSLIEIPVSYQVIQFAILPSGDYIIFGYDTAGAALRAYGFSIPAARSRGLFNCPMRCREP